MGLCFDPVGFWDPYQYKIIWGPKGCVNHLLWYISAQKLRFSKSLLSRPTCKAVVCWPETEGDSVQWHFHLWNSIVSEIWLALKLLGFRCLLWKITTKSLILLRLWSNIVITLFDLSGFGWLFSSVGSSFRLYMLFSDWFYNIMDCSMKDTYGIWCVYLSLILSCVYWKPPWESFRPKDLNIQF